MLLRLGHGCVAYTSQMRNDQAMPLTEPGQVTKITGVTRSSSGEKDNRFVFATAPVATHVIIMKWRPVGAFVGWHYSKVHGTRPAISKWPCTVS